MRRHFSSNVNRYTSRARGDADEAIAKLTSTFRNHFVHQLRKPRTIGREAEFPVVNADGSAADVRSLLNKMDEEGDLKLKHSGDFGLYGNDADFSLEVGYGTIEVITGPFDDLHQLKEVHESAVQRVVRSAEKLDMRVLGFGCHPIQPDSEELLTPKRRYKRLHEVLADPWLRFTITASDQVHIDITEPELLRVINVINLLTPSMVALAGNSSIHRGITGESVSMREQFGTEMGPGRHGMADGPFYSVLDYITAICKQPQLLRAPTETEKWDGVDTLLPVMDKAPFLDRIAERGFDWEAYLVHEHYVWHAGRPRVAQGTMEVRPMCQQPWDEHMAPSALALGLVQSAPRIVQDKELVEALDWGVQRKLMETVTRTGLGGDDEHLEALLLRVLHHAKDALVERGGGEEVYLEPMFHRLSSRTNPGQKAVEVFEKEGMDRFLDFAAIPLL